ncbi:MAG TPA: potassium transporter TrkG [Neobacillus sp.]
MIQNKSMINSFRYIFLLYISVIVLFAFFYMIPISHNGSISFVNSLFLSTSALSVTGLTTINISENLSKIGQVFLIFEMQLGGLGILVLISYLFLMMGKRITMSNMLLISRDQNQSNLKTIKSLSFSVLIIALMVESVCSLIVFGEIRKNYDTNSEALFVTIFHSVASFTNSGFDLFGDSLHSYQQNPIVLYSTAATIFLGSIGFPTIMEYIFSFRKRKSLFTKINIRLHTSFLLIGSVVYFLLEYDKIFHHLSVEDKISNSVFLAATNRSAGFTTVDISSLTITTVLIIMFLMFIGGASSSTGGGIRLTTFRVIFAKMLAVVKSQEHTVIGKKAITQEAINKSFFIFISFILLAFFSTILLTIFENFRIERIAFEVLSALTNTGLTMGITSELSIVSKFILILLMIIGRIGIFTLIYFVFKIDDRSKTRYLKEDLAVG